MLKVTTRSQLEAELLDRAEPRTDDLGPAKGILTGLAVSLILWELVALAIGLF